MKYETKLKREAKKSFDKYYSKFTKYELMHMLLANLISFHIDSEDYLESCLKKLKELKVQP